MPTQAEKDSARRRVCAAAHALEVAVWAEPRMPDLVRAARVALEAAQRDHRAAYGIEDARCVIVR